MGEKGRKGDRFIFLKIICPLFPFPSTANPLWELSSFSEAAKAVVQAMKRVNGIL